MPHEFMILRKGEFETYSNYEDIPLDFDHIIKFLPEIPPEPHSDEQHKEIQQWSEKFQRLIDIERKNGMLNNTSIQE